MVFSALIFLQRFPQKKELVFYWNNCLIKEGFYKNQKMFQAKKNFPFMV